MGAFEGAVEFGAHALETDLHLSNDNVVVISHVCRGSSITALNSSTDPGVIGCYVETMLWHRQENHRLRLGLPQPATHTPRPSRINASTYRPSHIPRKARTTTHMAVAGHKGTLPRLLSIHATCVDSSESSPTTPKISCATSPLLLPQSRPPPLPPGLSASFSAFGPQSSSPFARNTCLATQSRTSASPFPMRAGSSPCLIFASTRCSIRSWALAAGRTSATSRRKGGRS